MSLKIKNINIFKIVLDLIMAVLLVLMYNAKVINLEFHEIGGLFVGFLVLVHLVLNRKWVASVSGKILSKNLAFKLRFGYIMNMLLLISMVLVIVSGIFISKVVFRGLTMSGENWKMIHYASAASLVLVGIHLGLHWGFVMGIFKRFIKFPASAARSLCILITAIIVLFGSYSMYTSNFKMWISAPFTSGTQPREQFSDEFDQNAESNTDSSSTQDRPARPDGNYSSRGNGQAKGMRSDGHGTGGSGIPKIILTYTSIIGTFAVITYYIEKLLRRRKSILLIQKANV
jgi:hypothetical protein